MPIDAFEMAVVHRVFRRELKSVPELICGVRPGRRGRLNQVARRIVNVLAALHHHHMAEDELLWPKLHDRIPLRAADIQHMETDHESIAEKVVTVELRLAEWIAATRSATPRQANPSRATDKLIAELKALGELIDDHLSAEEDLMIPLINENITAAEWHQVTERGGSFVSGRNMWFGLAFVGMALEACTAEERRRFLAGMPPPQRWLVRLVARRAMASYPARLERAHGSSGN